MNGLPPKEIKITRRELFPLAAAGLGQLWNPDARRFLDGATEFPVIRLTDPVYESSLSADPSRIFGRRSDALYFASTRAGDWQLFRIEFRNGQVKQLTEAEKLNPQAYTLTPDERWIIYLDGTHVMAASLQQLKPQEIAPAADVRGTPAFTDDGTHLFWLEFRAGRTTVRRFRWPKGPAETLLELDGEGLEIHPNPRRAMLFVHQAGGAVMLAAFDGTQRRKIETPTGRITQAVWSADGQQVCYLLEPAERGKLITIHEYDVDSRADRNVAPTTQYARFARNADGSVFLGVSGQRASPMVLLLLRVTHRELSLCEHKASSPASTHPQFSPNSQRIVFQSDRDGKPALYTMLVDKQVEKTD